MQQEQHDERDLNTVPVGPLGIISMKGVESGVKTEMVTKGMGFPCTSLTVPFTFSANTVTANIVNNTNKIFFICLMFLKSAAKVLLFGDMQYEKSDIMLFEAFF